MFINWLFTVFPVEMAQAWRLVRANLGLWLTISLAMALAANALPAAPTPYVALATALASLVLLVIIVAFFDAAAAGRRASAAELWTLLLERTPMLLVYGTIAMGICLSVRALTITAVAIVLKGSPAALPAASALGWLVYLTMLVRFSFFPFLALLSKSAEVESLMPAHPKLMVWLRPLAWPLLASDSMTSGRRWRIAPYVVLLSAAPGAAASFAAEGPAAVAAAAATQMVVLTAQAALFDHFLERRGSLLKTKEVT